MTCEVAVMNKRGVALAADSAVTMGNGRKIYLTAEKLFRLSPNLPVAIMTFGAADMMDVPWETIVTIYTQKLGNRRFDTLEQYAKDFLGFMESAGSLFPIGEEAARVGAMVRGAWTSLYSEPLAKQIGTKKCNNGAAVEALSSLISEDHALWERYDDLNGLGLAFGEQVVAMHEETLALIEKEVFEGLKLPSIVRTRLRRTAAFLFGKEFFLPAEESGLVVAGIGEAEPFPVLIRYSVGSIVAGRLRYAKRDDARVGGSGPDAIVVPLAQREIIDLIIDGIHPELRDQLVEEFDGPESDGLAKGRSKAYPKLSHFFTAESQRSHRQSFMGAVSALPRQDLAKLAETLVDVTAFMMRMSAESQETVGGPVDVAILSKADGFTWVKHKDLAGQMPHSGGAVMP
jgi:hypothetical protein